jgi:hypothetical protein
MGLASALCLSLLGCTSPASLQAMDEAQCASIGAGAGTPDHAYCRIEVAKLRNEQRR